MTTLMIEDAGKELQAQISAAKARRAALGITPIEHRPARLAGRPTVIIAGDVNAPEFVRALREGGFELVNEGGALGMMVIRKAK